MPKWTRLAAGWALAAMFALALSWGAVASVRNQVIQPSVQVPTNAASTLAPGATNQTTTSAPTVIRLEPEVIDTTASTIDVSGSTTTTVQPSETTSTTTAQSPSTSTPTTTSVAPPTQISSYTLIGGVVTISHSLGVVAFVSAIPQPGYSTDRREIGPEEVRIRFESEGHTSNFRAHWSGGELEVTQNETGES